RVLREEKRMTRNRRVAQILMCLSMVLSAVSGNGAARVFFLFLAVIMLVVMTVLFLKEERE
ncbi:MAG TPA: hypothetical protein PKL54_09730, partial [Candidatus Hydrogenedentes bacterium]|nr:hypothetical protein [Candidatus Hydrogenedentota bacterium]